MLIKLEVEDACSFRAKTVAAIFSDPGKITGRAPDIAHFINIPKLAINLRFMTAVSYDLASSLEM